MSASAPLEPDLTYLSEGLAGARLPRVATIVTAVAMMLKAVIRLLLYFQPSNSATVIPRIV